VTGGTRGIGRGIAERGLAAGAEVVICGRSEPESLPGAGGRRAVFLAADVREIEQVERLVAATVERFGRLDVLVANAGGAPAVDAASVSPRFHEKIIALNLIAPLHCAQRANAAMQQQPEGGVIVFITSVSGMRPSPGTAAVCPSSDCSRPPNAGTPSVISRFTIDDIPNPEAARAKMRLTTAARSGMSSSRPSRSRTHPGSRRVMCAVLTPSDRRVRPRTSSSRTPAVASSRSPSGSVSPSRQRLRCAFRPTFKLNTVPQA
jgi:NAD(P)-dependent dehydrogenase (short-subunit alcohol dehydrogenase family)